MAKRTKTEALATREGILDAAELVFEKNGVSHSSLEDIAALAGVTRGAVYCHFKSKSDLFNAVMCRVCAPFEQKLSEIQDQYPDEPLQGLRHLAFFFLDRLVTDAQCFRVLKVAWHQCEYVGEMAEIRDSHMGRGNHFISVHEDVIRESCRLGLLPDSVDPKRAAIGLMAIVYGLAANWALDPQRFPLIDYGRWVIDSYLRGMEKAV